MEQFTNFSGSFGMVVNGVNSDLMTDLYHGLLRLNGPNLLHIVPIQARLNVYTDQPP